MTSQNSTVGPWIKPVAAIALVFGLLSVFSGGAVLFGPAQAQALAGDIIHFVVWFNFLAGGAYIIAAIGLWLGKSWAATVAGMIAVATAIVALGFVFTILRGSAYEMRTVGALAFRFVFWVAVALLARRAIHQR